MEYSYVPLLVIILIKLGSEYIFHQNVISSLSQMSKEKTD